jgi:hypothetical protein
MQRSDLPLLGGIAAMLRWLEELAVILSGPLLTFGLCIALIDLLTDGALTLAVPALVYGWAISQAVGVDGQLIGASFNIKHMARQRRWLAMVGYVLLVCALAYVAIIAALAFAYHQSQGTAVPETLRVLGIDAANWTLQRSILSVVLVILSGLLRYTAPKADAQDEATRLHDEITLAPLRAQAQAAKVLGVRTVVQAAVKGAPAPTTQPLLVTAEEADPYPQEEPTPSGEIEAIHLVGRTPRRRAPRRKPRGANNWEAQARSAWRDGARSVNNLVKAVPGMSRTAAAYWRGVFSGEERGAESARREA